MEIEATNNLEQDRTRQAKDTAMSSRARKQRDDRSSVFTGISKLTRPNLTVNQTATSPNSGVERIII